MSKPLTLTYWVTEDGAFGRVLEKGLCLHAETLQGLTALAEDHATVSAGLVLVPGEELPEEVLL